MVEANWDKRIPRMAVQRPPHCFADRLDTFTGNVGPLDTTPGVTRPEVYSDVTQRIRSTRKCFSFRSTWQ